MNCPVKIKKQTGYFPVFCKVGYIFVFCHFMFLNEFRIEPVINKLNIKVVMPVFELIFCFGLLFRENLTLAGNIIPEYL